MTMKHILAVALVAPFLTASAMAQDTPRVIKHVYVGGPGSSIPHTTRQVNDGSEAFAMAAKAKAPRSN